MKLPGEAGDEMEDDFLLLSDIFPTGFHATELANVQAGSTVAIFGDGPVGLLSALSAILKGASEVYVFDTVQECLDKAKQIGAIPIDFSKGDPVEQILEIRKNNPKIQQMMRPGEEKMAGVLCGIDAVGYQAKDWEHQGEESPSRVLQDLIRLVNPTGHIGVIGVYLPKDPGGVNPEAKSGQFPLWFGKAWEKGITIGMGQTPVRKYAERLRDIIVAGRAKPSLIVSKRITFDNVPEAYKNFDDRKEGYTKVLIKTNEAWI